jgi:hypothetical protein
MLVDAHIRTYIIHIHARIQLKYKINADNVHVQLNTLLTLPMQTCCIGRVPETSRIYHFDMTFTGIL